MHSMRVLVFWSTAFDRVSFIGLMKQGINRVIALPLTPIDEVIDEINELQVNNPLLPQVNRATGTIIAHEPYVATTDQEGRPQETLFSAAVARGHGVAANLVVVPEEEELPRTSEYLMHVFTVPSSQNIFKNFFKKIVAILMQLSFCRNLFFFNHQQL